MNYDARIAALTAENDELRERVRQLESLLSASEVIMPPAFGLNRHEERVLRVLFAKDAPTRDHILSVLYGGLGGPQPCFRIIDVYVSKLRKKLKPFDIEIKTRWGEGYMLAPASRAIIEQMISKENQA